MTTNINTTPVRQPEVILVLDLETLATTEKSVVTQVALIGYDLEQDEIIPIRHQQFYPIKPQIALNRIMDPDTILWWMTQPDEARALFAESASDEPEELPALIRNFSMMFKDIVGNRPYEIYANSPSFDCVILKSLFEDLGFDIPWDFRKERDLRTLCSLANVNAKEVPKVSGFVPHIAYWDARQQLEIYLVAQRNLRESQ